MLLNPFSEDGFAFFARQKEVSALIPPDSVRSACGEIDKPWQYSVRLKLGLERGGRRWDAFQRGREVCCMRSGSTEMGDSAINRSTRNARK